MPPVRQVASTVHDARNALTAALGRLSLLLRHLERGDHDRAMANAREAEASLRQLADVLDALDDDGPVSERRE